MKEGRIIKSLSGFYTVVGQNETVICKGRGVFRKRNITPLVGDIVTYRVNDDGSGTITAIKERKNAFVRPPIANMSQAMIVVSATEPEFSPQLLDRFLVIVEANNVKPIILITKMDRLTSEEKLNIERYAAYYRKIGYETILLSLTNEADIAFVMPLLQNELTVLTGQSGVGKSTFLNHLIPSLSLETGEISHSLGRGKHTTRHVELIPVNDNGYVADTPGFSSVDFTDIEAVELGSYFKEMNEVAASCKFRGCLHDKEPQCAVKVAVNTGEIKQDRYENYIRFLNEIQLRKPRYS